MHITFGLSLSDLSTELGTHTHCFLYVYVYLYIYICIEIHEFINLIHLVPEDSAQFSPFLSLWFLSLIGRVWALPILIALTLLIDFPVWYESPVAITMSLPALLT